MKRNQNDLEKLFNEMANSASTILFRGIMLFPFAAFAGFWITIKFFIPALSGITGENFESTAMIMGIGAIISCTIYFMAVLLIYDISLERNQQEIAKHILRELEKRGEIDRRSELTHKKYVRDIQKMAEGRHIHND